MMVKLRFLGKESTPKNSPTLYATSESSYIIQGWIVNDSDILNELNIPEDETVVAVPPGLLNYLALDGFATDECSLVPPIVYVKDNGHYIIQGKRVTDSEALQQMDIPEHESCVQLSRSAVSRLVGAAV
jgi:hypothetical protein